MSLSFPSAEWAAELQRQLDGSAAYAAAAATWTYGPVALVVRAAPALGLTEPVGVHLDVERGRCREVRVVDLAQAERAPFCILGAYDRWKALLKREVDPMKALLQGKLELKGQMTVIVRYVGASKALVECAARVPTRFLDDA